MRARGGDARGESGAGVGLLSLAEEAKLTRADEAPRETARLTSLYCARRQRRQRSASGPGAIRTATRRRERARQLLCCCSNVERRSTRKI